MQQASRGVRQPAGQQQPCCEAQVDQTTEMRALMLSQPFEDECRGQDEHQAIADAIEQAQQEQELVVIGKTLGDGDQGIGQQAERDCQA
ncbi:hypothetical protein D3C80_1435670 [compost metagenome]